jgi:hypothetical protein
MNKLFFALILLLPFSFGIPFEELPKVIEINGLLTEKDSMFCEAKILEHGTITLLEPNAFEDMYYVSLMKGETAIASFDFIIDKGQYGSVPADEWPKQFTLTIPYDEEGQAILIANAEGKLQCAIIRSEHNPQVKITSPKGTFEEIDKIEWNASDADEDDWLLADVFVAENNGL